LREGASAEWMQSKKSQRFFFVFFSCFPFCSFFSTERPHTSQMCNENNESVRFDCPGDLCDSALRCQNWDLRQIHASNAGPARRKAGEAKAVLRSIAPVRKVSMLWTSCRARSLHWIQHTLVQQIAHQNSSAKRPRLR